MLIKNTISESRNSQKINKGLMPLYRAPQRISQSLDPVNAKERLLRALWPLHARRRTHKSDYFMLLEFEA